MERRPLRSLLALFGILFIALLTACSDNAGTAVSGADAESSSKGEDAAPDACALLTAEDIEQVLGVAVTVQPDDQLKSISTTSLCGYEAANGGGSVVSIVVRLGPASLDADTNRTQYVDGIKMNMGGSYQVDTVEGLSGPAVWNPDMKQLTVFKGNALAVLTLFGEGDDLLSRAKTLGERALSRL